MRFFTKIIIFSIMLGFFNFFTFSQEKKETISLEGNWKKYDRVLAVVNDSPIIESDVEQRYNILKNKKEFRKGSISEKKSRVLDSFIEESILMQTAEEESIIVSDQKIDSYIKKVMESQKFSSLKDFEKEIFKREKLTLKEYREKLRMQMLVEQIMTYAIDYSPPSDEEARKFYNKNKRQLLEVNSKHIVIIPKNSTFSEQKKADKKIREILKRARSGESFEKLARQYSMGPSAPKGGALGWAMLATYDPYFANALFQMKKPGSISGVVKTSFGFHIIKYLGRRYAPFEDVKNRIFFMLAEKKRRSQFKVWVQQKRRLSDVKIYMKNYTQKGKTI